VPIQGELCSKSQVTFKPVG